MTIGFKKRRGRNPAALEDLPLIEGRIIKAKFSPKRPLRIFSLLIAFLLILPAFLYAGQYGVIRVVDGDTIIISYKGKPEKVRLLRVNTPESVHPDKKQNIPIGKIASDFTKKRLKGKYVDLEFEGSFRGRYGRLLAYVFVDGINFNLELVGRGLSPYYTKYGPSEKYDKEFREAERYARKHKLNIWGDPELTQRYLRLKSKWGQYRTSASSSPTTVQTKMWKYVASKRSEVFHHPDCKWAKKISPKNLIGFKSKEEAIKSGRRPCESCKPFSLVMKISLLLFQQFMSAEQGCDFFKKKDLPISWPHHSQAVKFTIQGMSPIHK